MSNATTVNITVTNSTVGVLSTGNLASISAINSGLSAVAKGGHPEIANALRELTEALLRDHTVETENRERAFETIEALVHQASLSPDKRLKPGALTSLFMGITSALGGAGDAASVWSVWGDKIKSFFGL